MAISLALIIIAGLGADYLFRLMRIPGFVGMLFVGVLVGPYVCGLLSPDMMSLSGDIQKMALIVILLRAGFELHKETLNRVGRAAVIMSIVPAIFEIAAVVLVAPPLLHLTYLEAGHSRRHTRCGFTSGGGAVNDRFHGSRARHEKGHPHSGACRVCVGRRVRHRDLYGVSRLVRRRSCGRDHQADRDSAFHGARCHFGHCSRVRFAASVSKI